MLSDVNLHPYITRHLANEKQDDAAWDFFLGLALEGSQRGGGDAPPSWVTAECAGGFGSLCGAFPSVANDYEFSNGVTWGDWMRAEAPEVRRCRLTSD